MIDVAPLLALALCVPGAPATERPPPHTRVLVRLVGPALDAGAAAAARGTARALRTGVRRALAEAVATRRAEGQRTFGPRLAAWRERGQAGEVRWLGLVAGFSVEASAEVVRALEADPAVASVKLDAVELVLLAEPAEPNVGAVNAPQLWALGVAGEGAVVAVLDGGVDVSHPDLAGRWRGGPGGWFDPYGEHDVPHDPTGHGTWVAGVAVGGAAGGTAIGVAPAARFIAAKVFPDRGSASAAAIHLAFEWALDPDGDPATDDAPAVVNASWGLASPGCDEEFRDDVRALRQAGILPVFAAGNLGPADGSGVSPASYPEALSVGAVDHDGEPWALSSRGPSACGGGAFPQLAAPGVEVLTADLLGRYAPATGTSLAAPHVAGAAALLASAFPEATADALQGALLGGARDLGEAGPDPVTGWGLLDVAAAHALLAEQPPPRVNLAPVAADDRALARRGRATRLDVAANDLDVDGEVRPWTIEIVEPPRRGRAFVRDGRLVYVAGRGWRATDSLRYRIQDGEGAWSNAATVRVRVR